MKWAVCYIVLNEEDYLQYSLESIYDFADQIIIVHGACRGFNGANEDGLSTDKTSDIILYGFPEGKITYRRYGWAKDKSELRNAYLSAVRSDIDWILVVDGDELYTYEQLKRLNDMVEKDPELDHIMNGHFWFWGDFDHICEMDKVKMYNQKVKTNGEQIFYDKYGNTMINGEYHERIFRNIPGLNYDQSHSTVVDKEGRFLYSHDDYRDRRIYTNMRELRRFHYGCLKPYSVHVARHLYYGQRDDPKFAEKTDTKEKLKVHSEAMGYFWWLRDGDKVLDKPNIHFKVVNFHGEHPEAIKNHPWFGETMSDFGKLPFQCFWEN